MQPRTTPATSRSRVVIALLIALVGAVWLLQGVGVLPGSFMSGDPTWAIIGAALIGLSAGYAALPRLRGHR